MTHVATFIASPNGPAMSEEALNSARALLPMAGEPAWLARGFAADIAFTPEAGSDQNGTEAGGADGRAIAAALRPAFGNAPVDVVVQPVADRRKRLLIADMDSTMIGQECIDELADLVGLKALVSGITERAMRGEIAFEPALRERVALLKGLPVTVIDDVIAERVTLMPGARTLVSTMRKHGAYTCLVSGGFTHFTKVVAGMIGFDEQHANTLLVEHGKLAGLVAEPILGREAKLERLLSLTCEVHRPLETTLAVGDGANDLAMIERAGLGVAYHAKPAVAAAAAARIDHNDLTALLYIQGYRQGEFVDTFGN